MSASEDNEEKLTPYQGKQRAFGLFECEDCKISWSSAWSWANTSQKCNTCHGDIYPHRQFKLKRSKGPAVEEKRHRIELCGKCKELGEPCTNHTSHPVQQPTQGAGRRRRRRRRNANGRLPPHSNANGPATPVNGPAAPAPCRERVGCPRSAQ